MIMRRCNKKSNGSLECPILNVSHTSNIAVQEKTIKKEATFICAKRDVLSIIRHALMF